MKKSALKLGNIPKKLKFYCRAESEFKFRWDDIEVDEDTRITRGHETFSVDAENTKTHATAESWAEGYRYYRQEDKPEKTWFTEEFDNEPIDGLVLIGLEHRGNGGRAYKVKVKDKYVFDLREDVLLDVLLNDQVTMGLIPGKFIFAKVGAEMKLIRVGSLLHAKMIEATDYWKEEVITKFEIGGVYRNKVSTLLYVGHVYVPTYHSVWHKSGRKYWGNTEYYDDHSRKPQSVTRVGTRKMHLFYEIDQSITSIDSIKFASSHYCRWYDKLPKSFRQKVGQLTEENLLGRLKERALEYRAETRRGNEHIYYDLNESLGQLINCAYDMDKELVHPFFKEHMLDNTNAP